MSISDEKVAQLEKIAKKLRLDIVMMIGAGKPGHLGGSCSIADIVAVNSRCQRARKIRYDTGESK